MLKPQFIPLTRLQLSFSPKKKLVLTCLLGGLAFANLGYASKSTDYQFLLSQYQEPLRSELQKVAQLVARQHSGKIIKIQNYSDNPEKYYRVKMINDAGYLKTYYIDQSMNKVRP